MVNHLHLHLLTNPVIELLSLLEIAPGDREDIPLGDLQMIGALALGKPDLLITLNEGTIVPFQPIRSRQARE
jgi:hypothetical protein